MLRPWWEVAPSTPAEAVTRAAEEPAIIPAAAIIGGGTKIITKTIAQKGIPTILAVVGGAIGGYLLGGGGGGKQELAQDLAQAQEVTQIPTVTPTQDILSEKRLDMIQKFYAMQKLQTVADITITPEIDIDAGRDVFYSTTTSPYVSPQQQAAAIQQPSQIDIIPQITVTPTTSIQLQEAEQKQDAIQETDSNWLMLAALGVAALFGYLYLKRKKKI